ncbi:MAG: hydantoinase/oxoprolinase family protein [Alphaproteobacteria bacterium]|jgi:N-methylhydantoinase A|nr:hydantoinase/oxoprolinase family protein [Alphaproteobacteria bacterium]MBT4016648.1 hydantoinase/oxoprolinase family protein [Alphaproteobacteria bacterium]MBT4966903.1 hydantoinase/oxoprolinase family protein [Alphaproteobacteria bacterium]MBT5161113.1 hydantoinase/oxoprolinase family protein [Alphaproteobacteria bacterium]MBT5917932.1 hydantoinase/oxoprolinase family protein [Alphaproteobacteria bacterium]
MPEEASIRIGVDVGGTFTDFALALPQGIKSLKLPTTNNAPEQAILDGVNRLLGDNNISPDQVTGFIHGTTLATNAIISRTGARTALLTTAGFRDVLAQGDESRFDQYDINITKPEPLVPRWWRYGIPERLSAEGNVLLPLDEDAIGAIAADMRSENIESVAICFLHAHTNPDHEQRARDHLQVLLPSVAISLSSDVSPEIGEYSRFSTTAANAYVQPVMSAYLERLQSGLTDQGIKASIFMFLSNGGLCDLDTARRFPIRLVESGPAGGAVFAGNLARELGEEEILAFDMGGTTAKVCLIDHGVPGRSDSFEMAREHMHRQGSGLPARIPVIDLVEIGAGGGSIAQVDSLKRLHVGPTSAGATPGPACYSRGGEAATVTDANLLLGRLAANDFTGSGINISVDRARDVIAEQVGKALALTDSAGAAAISEVVEEQMAGAAREHAREKGIDLRRRSMVAFGGAAPLHAVNVAAKLGINRVIIPQAAGIGSAIGFLQSSAVFEISHSIRVLMSCFDASLFNQHFAAISRNVSAAVEAAAPGIPVDETRTLFMHYKGQGHSLAVEIPTRDLTDDDAVLLLSAFEEKYISVYRRPLAGIDVECVGISLRMSSNEDLLPVRNIINTGPADVPDTTDLFDLMENDYANVPTMSRSKMEPDTIFQGPGLIKDDGTTVVVPQGYIATCYDTGHLVITLQGDQA